MQRLADAETQLVLARMVWNLDIELVDKESVWTNRAAHWSWVKTPLLMRLMDREKGVEKGFVMLGGSSVCKSMGYKSCIEEKFQCFKSLPKRNK